MSSWKMRTLLSALYASVIFAAGSLAASSPLKLDFKKEKLTSLSKRASGFVNSPLLESPSHTTAYFIDISIGTPPQPVLLLLDTGSSDIFIISSAAENATICAGHTGAPGCERYGVYNENKSSSYQPIPQLNTSIRLPFGSSASYGTIGIETVHLEGVAIPNMTFYDVDRPGQPYGILGVGYPGDQVLAPKGFEVPTIIDQLVQIGQINRRAFSLYLDDQQAGKGSILFGGIDSSKYTGDLITVPVTPFETKGKTSYLVWRIPLTSVSFTGMNTTAVLTPPDMATPGIIDSGTATIYLPVTVAHELYKGIGAVEATVDGVTGWVTDCSNAQSNASLSFQFGSNGPTIDVSMNQIINDIPLFAFGNGVPACLVQVMPSTDALTEEVGGLLLGDPLIRNAYVVYDLDNNEISLAQANLNQTGSNIQVIPAGSGLPGVSVTGTQTATQVPIPTNTATQSGTGGFISNGQATSTGIPKSVPTPTFSLGVRVATTGSGIPGQPTGSTTTGTSATPSGNGAGSLQPAGSMRWAGILCAALAGAVVVGMVAL